MTYLPRHLSQHIWIYHEVLLLILTQHIVDIKRMPHVGRIKTFLRHPFRVHLLAGNLVSCGLVYQVLNALVELRLVSLCLCDAVCLVLAIELFGHVLLLRV